MQGWKCPDPDCQLRPDVGQSGAEDPQRQKDGGGLDAEGTRTILMELEWKDTGKPWC